MKDDAMYDGISSTSNESEEDDVVVEEIDGPVSN